MLRLSLDLLLALQLLDLALLLLIYSLDQGLLIR